MDNGGVAVLGKGATLPGGLRLILVCLPAFYIRI